MEKTLSGKYNLNDFPRSKLFNEPSYRGVRWLPAIRSERPYAGAGIFKDMPVDYAYTETKIPSMKRQARPYGVY